VRRVAAGIGGVWVNTEPRNNTHQREVVMKFRSGRVVGACTLTALVAGAAVAAGAIPDSGGTIHACYATGNGLLLGIPYSKGDIRAVNQGEACRSYEKPLSWNQNGSLSANVSASHNDVEYTDLVNSDATSVSRSGGGYDVTFAQNIRGCAATASTGPSGGPHGDTLTYGWATADTSYNDHTVHVDVFSQGLNGLPVHEDEASFHLIVAC
jgi:hypothetical protein